MNRIISSLAAAAVLGLAAVGPHTEARAQTVDNYIGQLQQFGTNWCPKYWALANGQLMSIAQNQALFSLIGNTYGGDGITTFALPDLRERAPAGVSQSAPLGARIGQTWTTLTVGQLAAHTHVFNGDPTSGVSNSPSNSMMGDYPLGQAIYGAPEATPDTPMNPAMMSMTGGSQPVLTLSPILATNWCIALSGIYPSRP
jgi:microcystin-dependent protein